MLEEHFYYKDPMDYEIFTYKWSPSQIKAKDIKGIVQIVHGMGEQSNRYRNTARELVEGGFVVYSNDHRGHGKTAKNKNELGFIGESDGFTWLTKNIKQLNDQIKNSYPNLPIFLLGHSMGSMLAQNYIIDYGDTLQGLILSGSPEKKGMGYPAIYEKVKEEISKYGENKRSELIAQIHFGEYNKQFAPNRTDFDFMSRDESVIKEYLEHPTNGFIFPLSFYKQLYQGMENLYERNKKENISKNIPIYIFAGNQDPVGRSGEDVKLIENAYKNMGLTNVVCHIYDKGRHEMLNEVNKKEVMINLIKWLNKNI